MNQTIEKFGYPNTLVRELDHWCILLRPAQATLGALVLVCKDEAQAFSDISKEASMSKLRVKRLESEIDLMRADIQFLRSKVKGQDAAAWEDFHRAMQMFRDRCMAYAKEGALRGLEIGDLRTLIVKTSSSGS